MLDFISVNINCNKLYCNSQHNQFLTDYICRCVDCIKGKELYMLSLKNIVKEYRSGDTKVQALKGISIDFREHEFVAILGQLSLIHI